MTQTTPRCGSGSAVLDSATCCLHLGHMEDAAQSRMLAGCFGVLQRASVRHGPDLVVSVEAVTFETPILHSRQGVGSVKR